MGRAATSPFRIQILLSKYLHYILCYMFDVIFMCLKCLTPATRLNTPSSNCCYIYCYSVELHSVFGKCTIICISAGMNYSALIGLFLCYKQLYFDNYNYSS